MNFLKKIYKPAAGLFLISGMSLAGCTDDALDSSSSGSMLDGETSLAFTVRSIASTDDSGSKAWTSNKYEDYLDFTRFKVLFFDKDNRFLFRVDDTYVTATEDGAYVRMTRNQLYPSTLSSEQLERRKKAIEGEGFKIAVLANWPDFVETRKSDSDYDADGNPTMTPMTEPVTFDFTEDNTIYDLSHIVFDNVYGAESGDYGNHNNNAYTHVTDADGNMGAYTIWVQNFFMNKSDAAMFIRYPDPSRLDGVKLTVTSGNYEKNGEFIPWGYRRTVNSNSLTGMNVVSTDYSLNDLWRVWSFTEDYDNLPANGCGRDYWAARNSALFSKEEMTEFLLSADNSSKTFDNLEFLNVTKKDGNPVMSIKQSGGVKRLHVATSLSLSEKEVVSPEKKSNVLHFRANAEGTLNIRTAKPDNGRVRVVEVREGVLGSNSISTDTGLSEDNDDYNKMTVNPDMTEWSCRINPQSKRFVDVFIFAYGGTIQFEDIEYIKDTYVYDTDRIGVMPDGKNPIPMYGLQEFDPIKEWVSGDVYDLSNPTSVSENYNHRKIHLIRSLAKVEIRINKSIFANTDVTPAHVYLRSCNRSARSEIKDVSIPTDILWYGDAAFNKKDEKNENLRDKYYYKYDAEGILGEFKNIFNYGPLFVNAGGNTIDDEVLLQNYWNKTSWFFGSWAENNPGMNWNWNGKTINVPNQIPVPRVFNSRVDRSDYIRFAEVGDDNGYYLFVLYVPEKNVDDANDRGDYTSRPKVPHIEIRFDGMNNDDNLDDNGAFRIFFSDYKENADRLYDYNRLTFENLEMEMNRDNLKDLFQPIIRNHVYQFTVNGVHKNDISFKVCGPANRDVNIPAFD